MDTPRLLEAHFEAQRWEGPDWTVMGAVMRERLNEPYYLRLEAVIPTGDLEGSSLLGSSATFDLERGDSRLRVCGVITMVRESTDERKHLRVHVAIEPALAALRFRSDSRIFQNLSVPEILEQVLGADLGAFGRSLESRLEGSYPTREYTVQYHETDFDFVHRLMEEEGIGYTFEHDGDAEVLVLFDQPTHHLVIEGPDGAVLRHSERRDGALDFEENVFRFDSISRARPNRVVARHFDWTHPSVPIEATSELDDPAFPTLETYVHDAPLTFHGYDHTYGAHNMADQLRLAAERTRRDAWLTEGRSTSLLLRAGRRFELMDHSRVDLDGDWVVTEIEHRYATRDTGPESTNLAYENRFTSMPAGVPWRPDRTRPPPRIVGVQTATVVGPAGEEIHCDPHGRVKVHFHWDRLGERDDHDSCWIRVMQTMGGPGWGFSFIPRIGMEVVVTFIEGDPNQPLITGVVYNGENPTPYEFPADKTRTTIRTNSSPGGEGFNELRFEDKAGGEEIWLHGEKDWNTLIKNDLNREVGHCESQKVEVDRSREVGHDEQIHIGHDQVKRVDNDESDSVGHDRMRDVGNNETISIGVDQTITVGHDEIVTIGNDEVVSIGNDCKQSVGKNLLQSIGQNMTQQVLMNAVQTVGQNLIESVVGNATTKIGGGLDLRTGADLTEKVGASLHQKVKRDHDISVDGKQDVKVGGKATMDVDAGYDIDVTGNYDLSILGQCVQKVAGDAVFQVVSCPPPGESGDEQESEGADSGADGAAESEESSGEEEAPGGNSTIQVEKVLTIDAGERLTILVEDVTINIADGAVVISGPDDITIATESVLRLLGDAGVEIQSAGDVKVNGSKVLLNC